MQELEYIKKAEGGKIVIDVPKEFEGKELCVSISAVINLEDDEKNWHLLSAEKKLQILQHFKGTAKYPDVPINKHNVYDQ